MTLSLSAQEVASFDGRHRLTTVQGPLTLFRICGRNAAGAAGNPYGRYWFNEKFFWSVIDLVSDNAGNTAQLNHYLRFVLRELTAVCNDWNSFAAIYRLTLPPSERTEVAVGRIAPQPFFSATDRRGRHSLPHELLIGGEFQYIVDVANNPKLKSFVQGPRPLWFHHGGSA